MRFDDLAHYLLKDRDGDFVERVEDGRTATVKVHFIFTADRSKARRFTEKELHESLGSSSQAQEFQHGFSGGKAIRL